MRTITCIHFFSHSPSCPTNKIRHSFSLANNSNTARINRHSFMFSYIHWDHHDDDDDKQYADLTKRDPKDRTQHSNTNTK
mmetsp:Transcript_21938/g.62481  ORF Transcript_21938/g.62481 Transcript_21938/m.62481 type:complete len:80 (+) Transcript_21938:1453-1692(+)